MRNKSLLILSLFIFILIGAVLIIIQPYEKVVASTDTGLIRLGSGSEYIEFRIKTSTRKFVSPFTFNAEWKETSTATDPASQVTVTVSITFGTWSNVENPYITVEVGFYSGSSYVRYTVFQGTETPSGTKQYQVSKTIDQLYQDIFGSTSYSDFSVDVYYYVQIKANGKITGKLYSWENDPNGKGVLITTLTFQYYIPSGIDISIYEVSSAGQYQAWDDAKVRNRDDGSEWWIEFHEPASWGAEINFKLKIDVIGLNGRSIKKLYIKLGFSPDDADDWIDLSRFEVRVLDSDASTILDKEYLSSNSPADSDTLTYSSQINGADGYLDFTTTSSTIYLHIQYPATEYYREPDYHPPEMWIDYIALELSDGTIFNATWYHSSTDLHVIFLSIMALLIVFLAALYKLVIKRRVK